MKTLSLCQPWAELVVIGAKRFETRSWATKYRGPLLIHASKKFTKEQQALCFDRPFVEPLGQRLLDRGRIIGRVEVVDCITAEEWLRRNTQRAGPTKRLVLVDVTQGEELFLKQTSAKEYDFGDFSYGRFAWQFENPVKFDKPIEAKGSLGIWEFPESAYLIAEKAV